MIINKIRIISHKIMKNNNFSIKNNKKIIKSIINFKINKIKTDIIFIKKIQIIIISNFYKNYSNINYFLKFFLAKIIKIKTIYKIIIHKVIKYKIKYILYKNL